MNLQECLEEYKNLTLELIESVQSDKDLSLLIEKRDNILKVIHELKFNNEEFQKVAADFKIVELNDELLTLVSKEKAKAKEKLEISKRSRMARRNYISRPNNPVIFSTKL